MFTQDKRVKDVMTPVERVYSFEASVRLNFATMMEIYRSGAAFWPWIGTSRHASLRCAPLCPVPDMPYACMLCRYCRCS